MKPALSRNATLVVFRGFAGPLVLVIGGGPLRTLRALVAARGAGVTTGASPAPRLSAEVFMLRAIGLAIEAETLDGPGPQRRRYVLRSPVAIGGGA